MMCHVRATLSVTFAFLLSCAVVEAETWYVDGVSDGDGTSWHSAFSDLQDALAVAIAGDDIWISAGTYRPDRGIGDRTIAFEVPCGVALYGGFNGTEQCRDDRNWESNETILSGDLNGDDGALDCDQFSNCCLVQEFGHFGCDEAECEAIVCAARPGCCNGTGFDSWDLACVDLARKACCHLGSWGTCDNSHFVVRVNGCAEEARVDGVTIRGAYFQFYRDGFQGFHSNGGLHSHSGVVAIANCRFLSNYSRGISIEGSASVELVNCSFNDTQPGVSVVLQADHASVRHCRFTDGARLFDATSPDIAIESCSFAGNANLQLHEGASVVTGCTFRDGSNGMNVSDGYHFVRNSYFFQTTKHIQMYFSTLTIDNCVFVGSTHSSIGGYGSGLIRNCAIVNNRNGDSAIGWTGSLGILNSTIVGNAIAMNPSNALGGGISFGQGSLQVLNSIIWGNGNPANHAQTLEENQIRIAPEGSLEIDYSVVQYWSGMYEGPGNTGNSGVDPMFVNINGADGIPGTEDDNARLSVGSPLINAGLHSAYALPTDLDGHARVLCGRVDMGAYESGFGDGDCDGVINAWDFAVWVACAEGELQGQVCETMDSDADGDIDLVDFAVFQRLK